jgi:hypothetical protein
MYAAGVAWGLLMTDARPAARVGLALLWPLGPLAFMGTVALLLLASLVAMPAVGAAALLALTAAWWVLW